jgi:hypothetical protein
MSDLRKRVDVKTWRVAVFQNLVDIAEMVYLCPRCGAWVSEPVLHEAWHFRTEGK